MLTGDALLAKVKELTIMEPTKPVSQEQSIARTQRIMTEITIRDYTTEGSLAYYIIEKGEWIYDGYASTLDGAFEMIKHNLEYDYYKET